MVKPRVQIVKHNVLAKFRCSSQGNVTWYAECGMKYLSSEPVLHVKADAYNQGHYQCQGFDNKGLQFISRGLLKLKCE